RELHDTLAQGVAGLVLQLEAVKAHLASGRGDRGAAIIDQALKRARSTLADSRAAIDDLRSAPSNLLESIREKIERFKQATGIPCELDLSLDENYTIPNGADEHTLRVLSEALVNITRHAQAAQVWVQFAVHDDQLVLEIRDNGQGFDPETATRSGHYGLLGMRERARLAGGTLTIQSHMGRGTHIKLLIPTSSEGTSS
ncbi:MAG: sensor histidine kinase, partial [Anaerolineales bacterium]|nr:sensor histidine kinase [Anaerolineales bacterium]